MSKRLLKWLVVAVVLLAVLGAAGVAGLLVYRQQRNARWLATAEAAYEEGDWQTAVKNYAMYIYQHPDDIELLFKYADANMHIIENRGAALAQAQTAYNQVLFHEPGNEKARQALLELYEKQGAWSELEYRAEQWLEDQPEDLELMYKRANALDRLGRTEEAVEVLEDLLEKGYEDPVVYDDLARLLRNQNRDERALELLDQALERHPENGRVHLYRARYFARARELARMEEEFDKALAVAPEDPEVLLAAGQFALTMRDTGLALTRMEKALAQEPGNIDVRLSLANALEGAGRVEEAIEVLRAVPRESYVDSPAALITLADLQLEAKRFEAAHETIAFYGMVFSGHTPILNYLDAREKLVRGDATAAAEQLLTVVQQRPRFLPARFALAQAYLDTGQRDLAQAALDEYLRANPRDLRAQGLYAREFSRAPSLVQTVARAGELAGDEKASPAVLSSVGVALLSAALRTGTLDEHGATAENLLRMAIRKEPAMATPYQALVTLQATQGKADLASQTLAAAREAGIEPDELYSSEAEIALAAGEDQKALESYKKDVSGGDTGVDGYVRWSQTFARQDRQDTALELLAEAAKNSPSEVAVKLTIERAALAAQLGRMDDALQWLERVEPGGLPDADAAERYGRAAGTVGIRLSQETGDPTALAKARDLVENAPELAMDVPEMLTARALLLLKQEPPEFDEAESLFRRVVSRNAADLNALLGLAYVLAKKDEMREAMDWAQRAVAAAPRSTMAMLRLSEIRVGLGRHREAVRGLEQVLVSEPGNVSALRLLAQSYLATGQFRDAEQVIARLESAGGSELRDTVRELRARLMLQKGDPAEAESSLRALAADNPEDFRLHAELARALALQGRGEAAEQVLTGFMDRKEDDPAAWVMLADFYLGLSNPAADRKANTALTRALVVDPDYAPALRRLVTVHMRRGAPGEALALCGRYLAQVPDDPDVLFNKALLSLGFQDELRPALDSVERAIELAGEQPEYLAVRGMLALELGDTEAALRDLQSASSQMNETSAQFDAALAEAYQYAGEDDLARALYRAAQDKAEQGEPVNRERMQRLGDAFSAEEQTE